MNNKTLYIFAGLFLALLAVFFVLQKFGPHPGDEKAAYAFPTLRPGRTPNAKPAEIDKVEIERPKGSERERLVFERVDRGWRLRNPAVRVDSTLVDRLVDQVRNAHKEESADVAPNLKELGLEPPQLVVTITRKEDGREFRLNVGNQSAGKPENAVVYVNSSEVAAPMAVRRAQLDEAFREVKDFLQQELLKVSALNTNYAQFDGPGHKPTFTLEKRAEDRWYFSNPADWGEADAEGAPTPADAPPRYEPPITGVKMLMEAVGAIQPPPKSDPVTLNAADEELKRFGLETEKYATLRIAIKRTANKEWGGEAFKQPVAEALLIGAKAEPDADKAERYYARREDERVVVLVPARPVTQILPVLANAEILRNRDLANLDRPKTDAIDLKTPEGTARLRRCGAPEAWFVYGGSEPVEADPKRVRDLLDSIISRRAVTDFPAEKPDAEYGFDKPPVVITAWANAVAPLAPMDKKETPPEPKLLNDPVVELTFGKTDNGSVYVRRKEGKSTRIVTVPAATLGRVALAPVAFRKRTLPSFTLDQAVQLELTRDGKTIKLENQAKEGAVTPEWKITAPAETAGPADAKAVDDILAELSRLYPERLVTEKADDLEKYGLKSPPLKAVVTLRKDARKLSYLFGKETEDKTGLYAKQGEGDLVFVVGAAVTQPLRGDLTDRSVFHFDPAKVKELNLSGWKKLGKGLQTLRLARAGKGWEVKEPPEKGFVVNDELVDDLVNAKLAKLSTEKFVVRGTGATAAHQLDEAGRSLVISVVVDGQKEPLTLTIGGLDAGEKAYFATASTRPRDVFLLSQKAYEEILKDGPRYFRKTAAK